MAQRPDVSGAMPTISWAWLQVQIALDDMFGRNGHFTLRHWVAYLTVAAMIGGLLVLYGYVFEPLFRRLWFGRWVWNHLLGEMQRVLGRDNYSELVDLQTHDQRRVIAWQLRRVRLRELTLSLIFLAIGGWICLYLNRHRVPLFYADRRGAQWLFGALMTLMVFMYAAIFAACGACIGTKEAFVECLYLSGWQRMRGARVRDPAPVDPGIDGLQGGGAYGNARPATADEAHVVYAGDNAGEPDLQFEK